MLVPVVPDGCDTEGVVVDEGCVATGVVDTGCVVAGVADEGCVVDDVVDTGCVTAGVEDEPDCVFGGSEVRAGAFDLHALDSKMAQIKTVPSKPFFISSSLIKNIL
jgi:hypothetical protein